MKEKNPPGHLKGRAVPKKQLPIVQKIQEEADKERQRAHEAEARATSMEALLSAQQEELNLLKEEQSRANAKMDLFMQELNRMSRSR